MCLNFVSIYLLVSTGFERLSGCLQQLVNTDTEHFVVLESLALLVELGGLYSFLEGHPGVKILDGTTHPLFFFFLLFSLA